MRTGKNVEEKLYEQTTKINLILEMKVIGCPTTLKIIRIRKINFMHALIVLI